MPMWRYTLMLKFGIWAVLIREFGSPKTYQNRDNRVWDYDWSCLW